MRLTTAGSREEHPAPMTGARKGDDHWNAIPRKALRIVRRHLRQIAYENKQMPPAMKLEMEAWSKRCRKGRAATTPCETFIANVRAGKWLAALLLCSSEDRISLSAALWPIIPEANRPA